MPRIRRKESKDQQRVAREAQPPIPLDDGTLTTPVTLEMIQALIPLGLKAVEDALLTEVRALAGPRYGLNDGRPEMVRRGAQHGSIYLADQKLPITVPPTLAVAQARERGELSEKQEQPTWRRKLQAAYAHPAYADAKRALERRLARLVVRVRKPIPTVALWLEETAPATFACFGLPSMLRRRRLKSTNSIELDHPAVRRRTRVIRSFPNEASPLRLGTALAIERNELWCARRYFNPDDIIITLTEGRVRMRRPA